LSGSVDGALVIDGNRSDKHYTLSLIGRDIPDDDDLAIQRASNGEWQLLGQAKHVFVSTERQAIRDLLLLHPLGLAPKEIAEQLEKKQPAVRKLLSSMVADGQVIVNKTIYSLPRSSIPASSLPLIHSLSSSSGGGGASGRGGNGGGGSNGGGNGLSRNSGNADHNGNANHSGNADHEEDARGPHALPV